LYATTTATAVGESERKLSRELFKLDVITRLEMGADCDAIAEEKGERR
jgi:hypothetical protein